MIRVVLSLGMLNGRATEDVNLAAGEHTESDTGVKQYIATLREEKPLVEMDVTARVNSAVDNSLAEFGMTFLLFFARNNFL